ncbi:MAG: FAD-dependent oxidoreductase [Myxococcota bacterium]
MTTESALTDTRGRILIEAEDFADYGGWVLDSQFEQQMGSPYLMAHGAGRPVADARTTITVEEAGTYHLWVRAKDWVPEHHPGRFEVRVDGQTVGMEFGANGEDWSWEAAGEVALPGGEVELALHDLTGFNGRCDALYFGPADDAPPNAVDETSRAWRRRLRGLPDAPVDAGAWDVVVVGGGIAGCAAALAAARLGQSVAFIQDRPVLGGNASNEIGLSPRGSQGALLKEFAARKEDGDLMAFDLLAAEPTCEVFLEHRVIRAERTNRRVTAIETVQPRGGAEKRFRAKVFIDASGTAILARLTGAETMFGRESKDAFGEDLAPEQADHMHHGNTLFFRTRNADEPRPFPEVPWATEVARKFANLSGQLVEFGTENGRGPRVDMDDSVPKVLGFAFDRPCYTIPATHFWEYGQWLDPYADAEHIRDYLLRSLIGTFSNVKKADPESFGDLEFEWLAFVPGQGEFHRYRGDYVLTESDIRDHRVFEDAVVANDGAFCIHCAFDEGETEYDFRIKEWIWDERDHKAYVIPFRCLYSKDLDNVLAAGKHISISHVAGSNVKFMGNGAQHGIAAAGAAALCNKYEATPRELYQTHLRELRRLVADLGCDHEAEGAPAL